MSRVKVKLADNIVRVVFIETDATVGATLGTNLYLPSGELGTPETIKDYLGVGDSGGVTSHRLLQGLTLGDDHPQYTRKDMLTTRGDLYVRNATTVVRRALGTSGQLLRSDGTDALWATLAPVITLGTDLTGNVTLTNLGNGTLNATIANDAVTYAKMQNTSAASVLLGRGASAGGDVQEITLGSGLTMAGTTLSASGGGGGGAGELVCFPVAAFSATPGGWAGYSVFSRFKGTRILRNASSIKVRMNIAAGSMIFSKIVMRRTLTSSTTYIDSTNVTFGGSATPTLTAGATLSDAIAVTVDSDHDYYLIFYINPSTLAGAQFRAASTDDNPNIIVGNFQLGDHTADASCGVGLAVSTIYGVDAYFTA
jgi:hypothetical protein